MKRKLTEKSRFWLATFMILSGIVLVYIGFFVPPVGEISNSVLGFFGEILAASGAILGIDLAVDRKITRRFKEEEENKWQEKIETEENDFDEN